LRYILLHKPYGIVSQFTPEGPHEGLASLGHLPHDVYAAGRLDADSEGLLLLTNDALVIHRLTDPAFGHPRTYLAEVEGIPDDEDLERLRSGPVVKGRKTRGAEATLLPAPPELPPRPVPVRFRKSVPSSWVKLTLTEGRNRQVRRMSAAVGHPTLRLIRIGIGPLSLEGLKPGEHRALTDEEQKSLFRSLGIDETRAAAQPRAGGPRKQ
jgi:23S rRNA pseudouridine2457 synthase